MKRVWRYIQIKFYRHYSWVLKKSLENPENASLVSLTIDIWAFGVLLLFFPVLVFVVNTIHSFEFAQEVDEMLILAIVSAPFGLFGIQKIRRWGDHINWMQNLNAPKAKEKLAETQAKLKALTDA